MLVMQIVGVGDTLVDQVEVRCSACGIPDSELTQCLGGRGGPPQRGGECYD